VELSYYGLLVFWGQTLEALNRSTKNRDYSKNHLKTMCYDEEQIANSEETIDEERSSKRLIR